MKLFEWLGCCNKRERLEQAIADAVRCRIMGIAYTKYKKESYFLGISVNNNIKDYCTEEEIQDFDKTAQYYNNGSVFLDHDLILKLFRKLGIAHEEESIEAIAKGKEYNQKKINALEINPILLKEST